MMTSRTMRALTAALPLTLALTGCVANTSQQTVTVAISDDSCVVTPAAITAGTTTFRITNSGTDVNEFYILAENQSTTVTEKENIGPGTTVNHVAELAEGSYFTACRFKQSGDPIGMSPFTVSAAGSASGAEVTAEQQAASDSYLQFVRAQVAQLTADTAAFTAAYVAGNDEQARALYATTRASYERIEPIAETFGDLDPRIDYREVDAVTEGRDWSGFHRIEKDLWVPAAGELNSDGAPALENWAPSTLAQRTQWADQLNAAVAELSTLVNSAEFSIAVADISNGAIALLDEVASGKLTGEEEWWSGTDLADVQANVEGAEYAFTVVAPLANDAALVTTIQSKFAALNAELATLGSLSAGFPDFASLTVAQKKSLSDLVNALSEPLSQLTGEILGAR